MINVFASWCPSCAQELDAFGEVSDAFAPRVAFVGIDTSETDLARSQQLLAAAHATYPVGLDTTDLTVASDWGVSNLPVTFFLRRDGTIAAEHLGSESVRDLRHEVQVLLAST